MSDDRLRLMFTCCHPALAPNVQVALTVRLLGGLTTAEIARAFLVSEPTMAQRLVRAKGRSATRGSLTGSPAKPISRVAFEPCWPSSTSYSTRDTRGSSGEKLVCEDLCAEAIRLGRLLAELMPGEPEVKGLLALMLLVESRRATRTTPGGDLVLLADQDRARWDRGLIAVGQPIVRECLRHNQPGPYQIQAAIHAVHSDAPTAADTDWRQILELYDHLLLLSPSPVAALNRAVAVAEVDGPDAALTLVNRLDLGGYYLFHAIRAERFASWAATPRRRRPTQRRSLRTGNASERDFLRRSRHSLTPEK